MTTTNDIQESTTDLIVDIYRATLGHDDVGPDSDFYEMGGDSMTAFQIVARLRAVFDIDVPVALVFTCPTPADLAAAVTDLAAGQADGGTNLN
ncbi:acyl carrier protein [Actinomadura sp. DC4]|uniref:acyl carrier protein n=1 Tax=Actinomadura sp. DC4 TaxID=3055069 RepID=UPI0025B0F189|nr:acyl carrier protein [Actinomadura sp. DC4]MDN3356429.1 acyl carrier protein [Actinomadura sp. DC4]